MWSEHGPTRVQWPRAGWSDGGPPVELLPARPGWWDVPQYNAADHGIGRDRAAILPTLTGVGRGVGHDLAVFADPFELLLRDLGRGIDAAAAMPAVLVRDLGRGHDRGLLGVDAADHGYGLDRVGQSVPPVWLLHTAIGADRAALPAAATVGRSRGVGQELGGAAFGWRMTETTTLTTTVTVRIPAWARYIDAILLGGGGGGAGGNQLGADGRGGAAGLWAGDSWDRGEGRNVWRTLSVTIGNGGGGGSRNNNGSGGAGQQTRLVVDNNVDTLTANGGAGGSGTNPVLGNDRPGKSPGSYNFDGWSVQGGSGDGNEPGSGGRGGGGSTWPFNAGSGDSGARGQAWIRFRM